MHVKISVKKVRFKDEDRFMIIVDMERQKVSDPIMSTSDLGNPPTKEEAINRLRELEVSESDIHRMISEAESEPS